jgi:hypothetical protein
MSTYRVIHIQRSADQPHEGWVVQKLSLGGNAELGSTLFPTKQQAQAEADKLAKTDPSNS